MGQTLSEPVTAKETSSCANTFAKVGSSCMQGWRINMEDAHTHLLATAEDKDAAFFAVYDGHGGAKVAQYAGNHLHKRVVCSQEYAGRIEEAMRNGFLQIDRDMIQDDELKDELAGTTAVAVLIKNSKIYCGNVGDSRAVASINGLVCPLSFDHKPANELEAKRIVAAGGWVEFNRVNGNLALSRALGDFVFKRNEDKPAEEQIVSACPDITVRDMTPDTEFIVLACDGIWDVLSNQEVVDFCRDRIAAKMEPEIICEELLTRCLAPDCQMGGLGCDNMTVVLVCLLQNESWEDLVKKCARQRPPTPSQEIDAPYAAAGFHDGGANTPSTPPSGACTNLDSSEAAPHTCTAPVLVPAGAGGRPAAPKAAAGAADAEEYDEGSRLIEGGGAGRDTEQSKPNKISKLDEREGADGSKPAAKGGPGSVVLTPPTAPLKSTGATHQNTSPQEPAAGNAHSDDSGDELPPMDFVAEIDLEAAGPNAVSANLGQLSA